MAMQYRVYNICKSKMYDKLAQNMREEKWEYIILMLLYCMRRGMISHKGWILKSYKCILWTPNHSLK